VRVRPSDGKPVGSPFDYDEYLTRLEDRRAADPEKYQRERAARRREREAMGRRWREQHDFDNANAELKQIRQDYQRRYPNGSRLIDIWGTIVLLEQSEKIDDIYLGQASRIANAKNRGRIRGVGRAARAAGF
jgi:hypothetical protein